MCHDTVHAEGTINVTLYRVNLINLGHRCFPVLCSECKHTQLLQQGPVRHVGIKIIPVLLSLQDQAQGVELLTSVFKITQREEGDML